MPSECELLYGDIWYSYPLNRQVSVAYLKLNNTNWLAVNHSYVRFKTASFDILYIVNQLELFDN